MGIEDKLEVATGAIDALMGRIDTAIRAPKELERLHKRILSAKAKLNGIDEEYKLADRMVQEKYEVELRAALDKVEAEAEARRRDLERDAERDHVEACATRVKAIMEIEQSVEASVRRLAEARKAERDFPMLPAVMAYVSESDLLAQKRAELSFVMASFRAIEKKTNPYDVIGRHFSEEVQKEIKKMLEDASFKAERLIVEMAGKSVQQPVTDGTPDK